MKLSVENRSHGTEEFNKGDRELQNAAKKAVEVAAKMGIIQNFDPNQPVWNFCSERGNETLKVRWGAGRSEIGLSVSVGGFRLVEDTRPNAMIRLEQALKFAGGSAEVDAYVNLDDDYWKLSLEPNFGKYEELTVGIHRAGDLIISGWDGEKHSNIYSKDGGWEDQVWLKRLIEWGLAPAVLEKANYRKLSAAFADLAAGNLRAKDWKSTVGWFNHILSR